MMHRDLKPQNVLLSKDGEIAKICDFGLSRAYRTAPLHYSLEVITLWYRPPEILLGDTLYTQSVDVWSLGCIFAEMVTRDPLFPGDSDIDQLLKIIRGKGTPEVEGWPELANLPGYRQVALPEVKRATMAELVPATCEVGADLMESFLLYNPIDRISCRDALAHRFFEDQDD
jgi:serine/threonine protein kinase